MSFANLVKNAPPGGRIKIKGGQTQGHVKTSENICVSRYTPSFVKGAEYAFSIKAEDNRAYHKLLQDQESSNCSVTGEGSSDMFQPEELTSIGTLPALADLDNEELTQVYQNYDFNPVEPSEHLEPIFDERERILKLIECNQVCVIKGPTGCGKSTQIPQFILDSFVERHVHCNIVVTQPRRIAATTLAQHVCKERKWEVGTIVGYQVGLDKKVNNDTRLTYCTTGVLLEKIINTKNLNDYTHIFLDEVHERDVDMDLTLLVVKHLLRRNSLNVKLILMSATMDVSRFAEYFGAVCRGAIIEPAPIIEIQRQSKFKVQVFYTESLISLTRNFPEVKIDEPTIAKELYDVVPLIIKAFNSIDAEDFKCKRSNDEKGAVLIFLPGLHQIETLYEVLESHGKKNPNFANLWICPLHSSITKDEQEKVHHYAPPGKRKIILSTNIAESSITIPDVKFVIDFCLTKHLVADQDTGFSSLQLAWASHTNCIQREGRAGRVQDGRVYRLVPKRFYEFKMSKECEPEMKRCPLQITVLKCKKMIEDECPIKLIGCALDPPDLTNYESTILKLKEVGALLTKCRGKINPHDGDLTFFGKVMASLPLDVHVTKLILLGHVFDVLEDSIIMGCAMSVRNVFSEPFKERLDAYNNKLAWADSSESDLIAYLNAYSVWRQLKGMGAFNTSRGTEEGWTRRYMLQVKHLREVAKLEDDIKRRLKILNIVPRQRESVWTKEEQPMILKLVLTGAFYPHYFIRSAQNPSAESDAVKTLSGHSPFNSVYLQNMPHPAPLYTDQLRECFIKNGISEDAEFFHNDTRKLIVSFNSENKLEYEQISGNKTLNSNIPGEIVMPVYRAIKLRQLRIPIKIKIDHPSVVKERLRQLSLHSRNSTRSQERNSSKPQIQLSQQFIEIDIVHIIDAGHFFAHIQPDSQQRLREIFYILMNPDSLIKLSGEPVEKVTYAAPYRDSELEDYIYYRVQVKKKFDFKGVLNVEVRFIDYGNTQKMKAQDLRELATEELQQRLDAIPHLALECTLAEVTPNVWYSSGGEWSNAANNYVRNTLVAHKTWFAKVYSFVNDVASIYLYLSDNPSDTDSETLNEKLKKNRFATYKEENYFSKTNNAKREQSLLLSSEDSSELSSDVKFLKESDMMLPATVSTHGFVEVKGPNSPLEMKLFSMAQCSTQKEVRVDGGSVNSVLLDPDPNDPHDRLLIAGSVNQTPDGRKLVLNHTTVLPNMHGLAALVCLIFAPVVEYRADDCFSRYTGALCGLGMEDGVSLFPANDIEIKFDVEFTVKDLLNVNKLRYWFNERFSVDYAEDYPNNELYKCQDKIKMLILELLKTTRRSVKVFTHLSSFTWGKIPEPRLLDPFQDTEVDDSKFIYKLHKAIELNPMNDLEDVKSLLYKLDKLKDILLMGVSAPNVLRCDLCDVDFDYCTTLRLHMTATYHLQLEEWLKKRAIAHKLKWKD